MSTSSNAKILGFAAYSGTGKTTLLKQLIPQLRARGLRIAIIKHSHHDFEIDHAGKDSYELHHAGSLQTLIASKFRSALITEHPDHLDPDFDATLAMIDRGSVDLVLVEGFREESQLPRIELHRPALNKPFIHTDSGSMIAIASDQPIQTALPLLDLNNVSEICDFICNWISS